MNRKNFESWLNRPGVILHILSKGNTGRKAGRLIALDDDTLELVNDRDPSVRFLISLSDIVDVVAKIDRFDDAEQPTVDLGEVPADDKNGAAR